MSARCTIRQYAYGLNCRTSRVWRDPLSRLDLRSLLLLYAAAAPSAGAAGVVRWRDRCFCCCYAAAAPSAGAAVATDKHRDNVTSRNDNNAHSLRDVTQQTDGQTTCDSKSAFCSASRDNNPQVLIVGCFPFTQSLPVFIPVSGSALSYVEYMHSRLSIIVGRQ